MINLPESTYPVWFVYLWGDRLYTEINHTLYVYLLSYLTIPFATYTLGGSKGYSALIIDNRLYVGGHSKLHIFELTFSLTEPLIPLTKIRSKRIIHKILRVGDDLLLG